MSEDKPRFVVRTMADALASTPSRWHRSTYKGQITWRMLCKIEPRLKDMQKRIEEVKDPGDTVWFCANAVWYGELKDSPSGGFKGELLHLVGWSAETDDPRIQTQAAYDLAYDRLYDLLPSCRNCTCF